MIYKRGDILQRESSVWISQDFLLSNTDLDNSYLRVAKCRASKTGIGAWCNTVIDGRCYFSFDAIGNKVRIQLPDVESLLQYVSEENESTPLAFVSHALLIGYKSFLYIYGDCNQETRTALAQAAAVIHEAKQYCDRHAIPFNKSAFFERLAKELETNETKYLPKSWRNLRDKIREYAEGKPIKELVYPKNIENKSAALFANNDLIKGWVVELAGTQKNYSGGYIFRKIRLMCEQHSIEKYPSLRWVTDYLSDSNIKFLVQKRYGECSRFNAHYRGYTPLKSALYAGDCWQIDGTRVNITSHGIPVTDKEGRRRIIQKFLYIVTVRDVMSGLPIGWTYCHEESADVVIDALATAVRNAGYLPYEIVYDRFPGSNTDDWAWVETGLANKGVLMTKTSNASGKANIERWFGTLQDVFMSESDYYYGEGVKSTRRYAHRAKEYVSQMQQFAIKQGFNFDDACRETDRIINAYCNTKLNSYSRKYKNIDNSPLQLHTESDKPNTNKIADNEFCYLFGLRKGVSIRNYLIQTEIEGAKHFYGVDDCDIAENYTSIKLLNFFDYEDLSKVHLYDGDRYLGTFNEVPQAQRYGKERDMCGVGITKAIAVKMEGHRRAKLQEIEGLKERALQELETTNDTTSVEVVVDVDETTLLCHGRTSKHNYESAESAFLLSEWTDEEELQIETLNQY